VRGRLDAVGAPPEVDRVEVVAEDLVLAALLGDLDRDDHLPVLAPQRRLVADEGVLDVLLVIVEPPPTPPRSWLNAARTMPVRSKPGWSRTSGPPREHGLADVRGHLVDRDDHPVALLGHEPVSWLPSA
jgi:hypothetical protein